MRKERGDSLNLDVIVKDSISLFIEKNASDLPVTKPSIPILYFGDLPEYTESELKVITVGLNPSHQEFPRTDRFTRFRKAQDLNLSQSLSRQDIDQYLQSLNDYFKEDPYNWFGCFEPLLNGLNASYYPNSLQNRALHTDICSPFATDLTWSKLGERHQRQLSSIGVNIWHRLVECLKPDLILISVARNHLQRIRFSKSRWDTYITIYGKSDGSFRSKPYDIEVAEYEAQGKKGYLVFGQAAQLPFGTLSNDQKEGMGQGLLKLFDAS